MTTLSEILIYLNRWASDPHDTVCEKGPWERGERCRHQRARDAIIQIENAKDEIYRDSRKASR